MHLEHNVIKPLDPDKAPQSPFRTPLTEEEKYWWPFSGPPKSRLPPLDPGDDSDDENTVKTPSNDV